MKNLNVFITILCIALTINMSAQVAPIGKKTLPVKENHEGEYLQTVMQRDISDVVIKAIRQRMPKKLLKYGFTDITIIQVGKVPVPEGWATKLGSLVSNKSLGIAMMETATTYRQMVAAIDKMYEPEDNDGVDWKFQVNIVDNISKETFKIRINMMSYNPMYIIKEIVEDFCSQITIEEDKFSDDVKYRTPSTGGNKFLKVVNGTEEIIYFYLKAYGRTASVNEKGVFILLNDKTIIKKPEVVISCNVSVTGTGYAYTALFRLSEDDINKLLSSKITDIKLYIYEEEIKKGERIIEYLKCLVEK